jgi:hypothetical protein
MVLNVLGWVLWTVRRDQVGTWKRSISNGLTGIQRQMAGSQVRKSRDTGNGGIVPAPAARVFGDRSLPTDWEAK